MALKSSERPKPKHRKGLWSPEEDQRLRGLCLQRNGKSCRLRWINYLRPGLKRGMFTLEEEEIILSLHRLIGNNVSDMYSSQLKLEMDQVSGGGHYLDYFSGDDICSQFDMGSDVNVMMYP
ncbi:hypothetical protein NL676_000242 [Syzygium grande]|nr:hypothetical protein NL676_000242 [Syzygium grande]